MLYPQGNWVEVSEGTPYYVIGESSYGKPLLDRALRYDTDMLTALKIGFLAFDATQKAANDVNFPLDAVLYRANGFRMAQHRFEQAAFTPAAAQWHKLLLDGIARLPDDWLQPMLSEIEAARVQRIDAS